MARRQGASGKGTGEAGSPDVESMSYEDAIGALEEIVERIESGEIGLEASIGEYERGVALIGRCRRVLEQAEQRISELDVKRAESGDASSAEGDRAD